MNFIGIDVGKAELHLAVADGPKVHTFANSGEGHRALLELLAALGGPCRVVVEATAKYSHGITRALHGAENVEVMVANPRATKHFAHALDKRGKTDTIDCRMLACFAAAMPFTPWTGPSEQAVELRRVVRRRGQLVAQIAKEKTRLIEERSTDRSDVLMEDIQASLEFLQGRVSKLEERALAIVQTSEELLSWHRLLVSIPGIADITAMLIMSEIGCLAADMSPRQLTAYAGLDPQPWQSGTMDATRRISKRGNKRLRTALFLAAWNTARFSPNVKAWRTRLIERGKSPKVADVAVARRLLHAIHAMRSSGTPWNGESFHPLPRFEEARSA